MKFSIDAGVFGEYNIQVLCSKTNKVVRETGFFNNLIVDSYFESFVGGTSVTNATKFSNCRVGTGITAPANTDTTITQLGGNLPRISDPAQNITVSGNTIQCTMVYINNPGEVVGSISEVSIWDAPTAGTMTSRARIKDVAGADTSITVRVSEYLKIIYRLNVSYNLGDIAASAVISGTTYNALMRLMNWNLNLGTDPFASVNPFVIPNSLGSCANNGFGLSKATATNATALAAVTSVPLYSTSETTTSVTAGTYTANSKSRKITWNFSLPSANIAGGVSNVLIHSAAEIGGGLQILFTPPLPKNSSLSLPISITFNFGR